MFDCSDCSLLHHPIAAAAVISTVCRLTGHARFRFDMLVRHGPLVLIPFKECNPELVKARLEEATGLPLYEAFAKSAHPLIKVCCPISYAR